MKEHLTESEQRVDALMKEAMNQEIPSEVVAGARQQLAVFRRQMENQELDSNDASPGLSFGSEKGLRFRRPAFAVIALAAAIVVAGILLWGPSHNRIYAQAVKLLANAPTLSCKLVTEGISVAAVFKEPGFVRSEITQEGSTGIYIENRTEGKGIWIYPERKTYREVNANLMQPPPEVSFINFLKSMPEHADEAIGERSIEGKTAKGFRAEYQGGSCSVWIHADTAEIVRIEFEAGVVSDFRFNKPVDDALFDLTPPAGYQKELNTLEVVQKKVTEAREVGPKGGLPLLYVDEMISLWHSGKQAEAVELFLAIPQVDSVAVAILECLGVKESDLPRLDSAKLTRIQKQFLEAAKAAKQLSRAIRSRISKAKNDGALGETELWKKRHQAFGRELMSPDYAAILNLVGVAIRKYEFK